MKAIKYRVSLDMFDTSSQTKIKAKKGDSACEIHITLTEHGKIYKISNGCSATFTAKKADGNFIYNECTIEGNSIVYAFSSSIDENGVCQVSACEGIMECEITLYKSDGEQLTSPRFSLYIDGTVYNGEEIESSSEYNALKELIEEVNKVLENNGGGSSGFSPIAKVEETENGAVITITDKNGTTTATVADGKNGEDGISATHSWNGTTLTITSASGTSSVDLKGEKGDASDLTEADKAEIVEEVAEIVRDTVIQPQKLVVEVRVFANGGIYSKDHTAYNSVKEGINHLVLVLDNDLVFDGTWWELCPEYVSLQYYNGTEWGNTTTLKGIGYSKGQCVELEGKWNGFSWDYLHILNLPSANTLTETDKTEIVNAVIEALPKAEEMTV